MSTYFPKAGEIARKWYVVDASDQALGRLASRVARILMGKENPKYTPFLDTGDHVVVINAEKVKVTGMKADQKVYQRYTGYPGGLRTEEFRKRADECYRLSVQLRNPEHKSVALYLAATWLELAQNAERQEAERDRTHSKVPAGRPTAGPGRASRRARDRSRGSPACSSRRRAGGGAAGSRPGLPSPG